MRFVQQEAQSRMNQALSIDRLLCTAACTAGSGQRRLAYTAHLSGDARLTMLSVTFVLAFCLNLCLRLSAASVCSLRCMKLVLTFTPGGIRSAGGGQTESVILPPHLKLRNSPFHPMKPLSPSVLLFLHAFALVLSASISPIIFLFLSGGDCACPH